MGKSQDKAFVRRLSDVGIAKLLQDYYECDISRQMVMALVSNGNIKNFSGSPAEDSFSYDITNDVTEKEQQ